MSKKVLFYFDIFQNYNTTTDNMTFSRTSDYADEKTTIGDNCQGVFSFEKVFKRFTRLKYSIIYATPQQNKRILHLIYTDNGDQPGHPLTTLTWIQTS